IFTLMYAGLATAWNIIGGYTGYVSLGHAAFFGARRVRAGDRLHAHGSGQRLPALLHAPLLALGVAIASLPIAWVAVRPRAATFAIATTLVFVVQQLAFNPRSLTGGSLWLTLRIPPFPLAHYERPFYYAMPISLCLALLVSWYVRGSRLGLHLFAI